MGGGSAGTILANQLNPRHDDVTLITRTTDHLFQPGLLYVAFAGAKPDLIRDEERLLRRGVNLVRDQVSGVDLEARTVTGGNGRVYPYDQLVLATGVRIDPEQIPGLPEVFGRFGSYHAGIGPALRLWAAINEFQGGTIAMGQSTPICICPPSPVEGALLLDRLLRRRGIRDRSRIVFFTPYPRAYPAAGIDEVVAPILKERGIEVRTFFDVDRVDPATGAISSIEGETIECDLPILIPPFVGSDLNVEPQSVLDESHFVKVDRETLRVPGYDNVYAIGDAAHLPTSKAGVGAHLEAKVVARELRGQPARFDGRTNCPMDLGDGRGTFVIGTYSAPVINYAPSRLKLVMKHAMGRMYWVSLRGWLEPVFDTYFRATSPDRRRPRGQPRAG